MDTRKKIAEFIATVGYIGRIRFAPGTFGSLPAFPLCYIIMYFTLNNKIVFPFAGFDFEEQQILSLFTIELLATIFIFFIGTYCTSIYIEGKEDTDPKEVVIDEVVGQMLTVILVSFSVILTQYSTLPPYIDAISIDIALLFVVPFILFRLFDIFKPWPINWLDQNIKGAWGVMIDDVAAAIFAVIVQYVFVLFLLDLFPIAQ